MADQDGNTTGDAGTRSTSGRGRSRGTAATTTSAGGSGATSAAAATGELTCPECGRSFARAAALGAHRKQAHGVAGTSKTRAGSGRRSPAKRRRAVASRGRARRGAAASASAATRRAGASLDRDALLQMLFPNGVPAREQALSSVGAWLDEAERLARMR